MTDSMKFGPEWLRNMSSDNSGGSGTGSTLSSGNSGGPGSGNNSNNSTNISTSGSNTTTFGGTNLASLAPRFQQAEFRYGREEMLSLCQKDMKLPEILPSFKKLFVEKEQLPLALSPSTEDENMFSFTPRSSWSLRSPVSLAPPTRMGRGGSVDRGRGRPRISGSLGFSIRPPCDEIGLRIGGRGVDRVWPERNGGNDIGGVPGDWNGSPSSSPRKEYNTHGRSSTMENWRRNRIDDDTGEGWRSSTNNSGTGSSYRWSRSTSWRDEDSSNPFVSSGGGSSGGGGGMAPVTRSFSSSASVGHSSAGGGVLERMNSLTSNGGGYKPPSQTNNSHDPSSSNSSSGVGGAAVSRSDGNNASNGSSNTVGSQATRGNAIWDQEDIPEWAMENTAEGGGSFDATGAFHVPNDDEDEGGGNSNDRHQIYKSAVEPSPPSETSRTQAAPLNGQKASSLASKNASESKSETERRISESRPIETEEPVSSNPFAALIKKNSNPKTSDSSINQKPSQIETTDMSNPAITMASTQNQPDQIQQQQLQDHQQTASSIANSNAAQAMSAIFKSITEQSTNKNTSAELADRMQEVADDMVEKLIMDDEMTSTASPGDTTSTAAQVPLMKSTVTSSSPTGPVGLQRPIQVHGHPMMVPQPQPTPSNELWYYRDPQNKIQGPFTGAEMAEWYRSDYFDESLYVRRVCDSRFATLGELVKMCGNSMPFLSSHLIPPLQIAPVMPLGNQPANVVPPGPPSVNVNQTKPINLVNPMLNTSDMAASLNLHLQYLQKEYLIRQHSLILSKLSTSEQFALMSPERQQQIIQQQMTQVSLPDNIVSLPAFINSYYGGANPSTFPMQQMMPGSSNNGSAPPKTDLSQVKMPGGHNPFAAASGARADFSLIPQLHNLMQGANTAQPPMAPTPQHQNSVNADDPIKALLRQLQAPKGAMPLNVGSVFSQNVIPGLQQMPWPASSGNNSAGPVSMWDFDPVAANVHAGIKPEMKTEQQILEEQRQQQQQQQQPPPLLPEKQQNDGKKFSADAPSIPNKTALQPPSQQKAVSQTQQREQSQPPSQPQQSQPPPQQQQQRASKKSEDKPKSVTSSDDTSKTNNKSDETLKKSNKSNKSEKKDSSKSQKQQNEEDRKREAAEERKKQKEEKKKQQMEEERKRQQQLQEEEKRRQMLEEKKRQEEIDRHRRAKMLENAPQKLQKSANNATDSLSSTRSSVAPWSNSGLPGIATPAASLAEIQKAERERRYEERLELMNQRKIQQMEMLSKVETPLTWNAPSISVKSLAEIQAEEHKQQLAFEQAVAAAEQRRKKDDHLTSSQSSSSFYGGQTGTISNVPSGSGVSAQSSTSVGSIWSSWNGKPAWSTTSSAGFWEEPAKIPTSMTGSGSSSLVNASGGASKQNSSNSLAPSGNSTGGGNRILSKSQTFSNIQTSAKNNQQSAASNLHSATSGDSRSSSNVTQGSGVKSGAGKVVANKAGGSGKGGSASNVSSGTGQNSAGGGGNNKKDDARNEFTSWCIKALSSMKSTVDVPTFIQFLQDIESPYEVKDYIRIYLGETKECTEFAKQFLERRSKYKNQQRAQNAHIDDMCSPAPAINPSSNDFQEVKGKGKKVKKNKMTKLDARILGFSVTAAQDRINVGDRDYGDAA